MQKKGIKKIALFSSSGDPQDFLALNRKKKNNNNSSVEFIFSQEGLENKYMHRHATGGT